MDEVRRANRRELHQKLCYQALGIDKHAGSNEILQAYLLFLSRHPQWHQELTGAYTVLTDPWLRIMYDVYGERVLRDPWYQQRFRRLCHAVYHSGHDVTEMFRQESRPDPHLGMMASGMKTPSRNSTSNNRTVAPARMLSELEANVWKSSEPMTEPSCNRLGAQNINNAKEASDEASIRQDCTPTVAVMENLRQKMFSLDKYIGDNNSGNKMRPVNRTGVQRDAKQSSATYGGVAQEYQPISPWLQDVHGAPNAGHKQWPRRTPAKSIPLRM